jgi:hypothetical protein
MPIKRFLAEPWPKPAPRRNTARICSMSSFVFEAGVGCSRGLGRQVMELIFI